MVCSSCATRNPEGSPTCSGCGRKLASWAPTYVGPLPETTGSMPTLSGPASSEGSGDGAFRPGQHVAGRYIISSLLGKGGVGMVYKAMDTTLGEEIAIKVLQVQTHRDPRDVERFKREILTARRITHPNVIRIHDFGTVGGEAFISMQLLTGGTLAEKIENGVLPVREAVNIAIGICEGLEAAHQEGIVHRDIKPDNVLFDGNGRPKLVDFGLARLANATTRTVGFSGTPFYMSPEQAEGTEATATSDVYSLGVLLYELFVGKLPFLADSLVRLVVLHTRELPPPPRSIRPELPEEIEAIILQSLEKDPKRRQGSAAEVAEQLKAWRSGLPVPRPARAAEDKTELRSLPGTESAAQRRAEAPTMVPSSLRGGTAPDRIHAPPPVPRDVQAVPAAADGAGGKRILLAAGGGVLAVAVLLAGFVAAGGFGTPSAVGTPVPTPTTMAVANPTATATPMATPTVAPTVAPTAAATPVVKSTQRATPAATSTRVAAVRTPAPTPPPARGNALLKVGADRGVWVKVSLDGKEFDESPFDNRKIPAGEHTLRFYNKSLGIDLSWNGTLAENRTAEFKVTATSPGKYVLFKLN